jgi:hypothetical protein
VEAKSNTTAASLELLGQLKSYKMRPYLSLDDPHYKLQTVESLTINPKSFYVRAKLRNDTTATGLSQRPSSSASASTSIQSNKDNSELVGVQLANGTPVTILYGSNSGTYEALAHRLAKDAPRYGNSATMATFDSVVGSLLKVNDELAYDWIPPELVKERRFEIFQTTPPL